MQRTLIMAMLVAGAATAATMPTTAADAQVAKAPEYVQLIRNNVTPPDVLQVKKPEHNTCVLLRDVLPPGTDRIWDTDEVTNNSASQIELFELFETANCVGLYAASVDEWTSNKKLDRVVHTESIRFVDL
jgi:hypothetical protein